MRSQPFLNLGFQKYSSYAGSIFFSLFVHRDDTMIHPLYCGSVGIRAFFELHIQFTTEVLPKVSNCTYSVSLVFDFNRNYIL